MNLESLSDDPNLTGQSEKRMDWLGRAAYRLKQFWQALRARPNAAALARAQQALSAEEYQLFCRMQPGEQFHSLDVLRQLQAQGHAQPALLAAALLHDVGKIRYPLKAWERALIVLAQAMAPQTAEQWGQAETERPGWRKAFVVAQHHAAWGAEMAAQAGSDALTVALIRRHTRRHSTHKISSGSTKPLPTAASSEEETLLALLQAVDDLS
jgi:transposase InsO family protein